MNYIQWPLGVNRTVLSTSSMSHNKNSVVSDKTENGLEMTRLSSLGSVDEWKVDMMFSNSKGDSFYKKHKYTEWEAFTNWFKYVCKMGTVPFYFHKIGDSSETQSCVYKIKSDGFPAYQFNGTTVKVSMTWAEVLPGVITVKLDDPHPDSIAAYNGHVEMWFSDEPKVNLQKNNFTFDYSRDGSSSSELVMEDFLFDGNKTCIFYYPEFTTKGIYEVRCKVTYMDAEQKIVTFTCKDSFEV